jgi:hypothetical protein
MSPLCFWFCDGGDGNPGDAELNLQTLKLIFDSGGKLLYPAASLPDAKNIRGFNDVGVPAREILSPGRANPTEHNQN